MPLEYRSAIIDDASSPETRRKAIKPDVVIHHAEAGGHWAEVPSISGCVTQGDSIEELLKNVREAIEGRLSIDVPDVPA